MSDWKTYAMVPSGVPWLGEVPKHWKVIPFRHCFRESTEVNGLQPVGEMLSISGYRGVEVKEYSSESQRRSVEDIENYRVVRVGQLAVNTMWMNYTGLGVSDVEGHMSPAYRAYDFRFEMHPRFVHHLLRSAPYVDGYTALLQGVRPNSLQMSRESLMRIPVLLPPLDEQKSIANYLDHQVRAQELLDRTLADLSKLLEARRSSNVTAKVAQLDQRGKLTLDALHTSAAPLRRLKFLAEIRNSSVDKHEYDGEARVRLCNYVDVYKNDFISGDLPLSESTASPEEIRRFSLKKGQVVLTKDSETAEDIGVAAYIDEDLSGVVCGYHLSILSPRESVVGLWLKYWLDSFWAKQHFLTRAMGTTRVGLGLADLGDLEVAVPPLQRQIEIASAIRQENFRMDQLSEAVFRIRSLNRDRRQSLIAAAVTGKIDVRGRSRG